MDELSAHETAIAQLIASGAGEREAALALGLSVRTVQNYLRALYSKFNVTNRSELAAALENKTHV